MSERDVTHRKYGPGRVIGQRNKGFELRVYFADGIDRWVRFDEVTEAAEQPGPLEDRGVRPRALTTNEFNRLRMIEAFRLGIVPHDCVDDFTFGREEEIKQLRDWLHGTDNGSLLMVGEYGTGKTHLLQYAYASGLKEGFAVAFVDMDPDEAPFHRPKRVYRQLVQTLKFRSPDHNSVLGFRDLVEQAIRKGGLSDHRYFSLVENSMSDEAVWEWLEAVSDIAKPVEARNTSKYRKWPGLYSYATTGNIYCYLLSGLGWAAKEVLGLKGLLLIFDEAEAMDEANYQRQGELSRNFVTSLIRTANDDDLLMESPVMTGLDYCQRGGGSPIPFLYKDRSGLKLLFAFTPSNTLEWLRELKESDRIDLDSLSEEAHREVFVRIVEIYGSAHTMNLDAARTDHILELVLEKTYRTRKFVKTSVEALDLARFYPTMPLHEVLR